MTERIDHEALATDALNSMFGESEGGALAWATQAQVHATLALVEQQRIANLIALAQIVVSPTTGDMWMLREELKRTQEWPDIAAALGIKEEA